MRQTRHNQSFLVGLTFGDLPEDVLAKGLASPTELAMIAILELLENAHGALNGGRRDDFFDRINHGRNNYGVETLFQQAAVGAITPSHLQRQTEPLKLTFVAAANAPPGE